MKSFLFISILLLTFTSTSFARDPGWPRQKINASGKLVYYQPQFGEWDNHKSLTFSMPFSLSNKSTVEGYSCRSQRDHFLNDGRKDPKTPERIQKEKRPK